MIALNNMSAQTLATKPFSSDYVSLTLKEVLLQVDNYIHQVFYEQAVQSELSNPTIEAVRYHFSSSGQQVRAKTCLDACMKFGIPYDDMLILAAVTELLHNASLIHDDIQDGDETRRNQPAVWKQFGTNIAICAGDLLLSTAYGVLANYSQPKLLPKLISTIQARTRSAIEGQSNDIAYKINPNISIEQYTQIAIHKSGALLSLPIELALIASEQNQYIELARTAVNHFAVGYQIADDLDDIIKDGGHEIQSPSLNISQSVNIVFVLKALGCSNEKEVAIAMCKQHLNTAIRYANQLPCGSGLLLISLSEALKNNTIRIT